MQIQLSSDQLSAKNQILDWITSKSSKYITFGGYAGTGKTTVIAQIRPDLKKKQINKIAFCAYTGKASRVLSSKLNEAKVLNNEDSVSTIHSLIYSPIEGPNGEIIGWEKKEKVDADLIIVDEASMITEDIWMDLLSYNLPILFVGDHGQLPPIGGKFNLMKSPQIRLDQIHRQAENNPIINVSMLARKEGKIPVQKFSNKVKKLSKYDYETQEEVQNEFYSFDDDTLVLCGRNKTRINLNHQIRGQLGFESPYLEAGERVICVKNNHKLKIVNGQLGYVNKIYEDGEHHYYAEIKLDFEETLFSGKILKAQIDAETVVRELPGLSKAAFENQFDRGYALTVHKSQGSQAKKVIVFEERFSMMSDEEWKSWLYTAVTRAEEELLVVG